VLGLTHTCAPPSASSSSLVRPCAPFSTFRAQCASLSSLEPNLCPHAHVLLLFGSSFGVLDSRLYDVFQFFWYGVCSPRVFRLCVWVHCFASFPSRHWHWIGVFWPVGSVPEWSQVSISSRISDISISRCDVVVSFSFVVVVVVKFFKSVAVMKVPAKCAAWVRYGSVIIFALAISRACFLRSFSVVVAPVFISGGSWICWSGSSSEIGGPVVAVHIQFRKSEVVVSNSSFGSAVTSLFRGGGLLDLIISPLGLSLLAEIAIWVSLSSLCCSRL